MSLILVTRSVLPSTEALEGKTSRDDEAGKVCQFCANWSLPYCLRFRSIFVYRESEPVHGSASIGAYGYPFLLNNDTVLPDLQIACSQDIQNAAVNGIDTPELSERNFKRFEDLSSIPEEDLDARIQALTRVLARREPKQYVEARIFRALTREDVVGKLF
jgi:hypothetical protein